MAISPTRPIGPSCLAGLRNENKIAERREDNKRPGERIFRRRKAVERRCLPGRQKDGFLEILFAQRIAESRGQICGWAVRRALEMESRERKTVAGRQIQERQTRRAMEALSLVCPPERSGGGHTNR